MAGKMKHVVLAHRHYIIETRRPGCLHAVFALAFAALVILAGYAAHLMGANAQQVNIVMLAMVIYALAFVIFTEARLQVEQWRLSS
jgi:hypothetical protein